MFIVQRIKSMYKLYQVPDQEMSESCAHRYFQEDCDLAEIDDMLGDTLRGCEIYHDMLPQSLIWQEFHIPHSSSSSNNVEDEVSIKNSVLKDTAAGRERLCASISKQRIARQDLGFTHTDGISYPINIEAQVAYMGQINAAQLGLPIQCFAHTMDNRQIEMTMEEMMALAAGVMAACEKINKEAWKTKEEIRASETIEEAWIIYESYFDFSSLI